MGLEACIRLGEWLKQSRRVGGFVSSFIVIDRDTPLFVKAHVQSQREPDENIPSCPNVS